jgi:aminoglycoside 2'-N-acetyltransferase I
MATLRKLTTDELSPEEAAELRSLFDAAFADDPEGFSDEDWEHATGGLHFLLEENELIIASASVVQRELHSGDHRLATGYVEAVATRPSHQGLGHGTALMTEVNAYIDAHFQLGALGGDPAFYARLGWVVWKGPTFARTESELVRTAEDDGYVMVRLTPTTPELDLSAPISCDWRPGEAW